MTRHARAAVVVMAAAIPVLVGGSTRARADLVPIGPRQAYVFLVHGATLGDLLSDDDLRALARAGGSGWMSPELNVQQLLDDLAPERDPDLMVRDLADASAASWRRVGDAIRSEVPSTTGVRVLVIVIDTAPSASMLSANDELRSVIMADAAAERLYRVKGTGGTLTSDSTRRTGIVAAPDVVATVEGFLGRSTRDDAGHVIRIVPEPPPFERHERYLAMRRMWVPVQTGAALYVTIAGLFALVVLWLGRRSPAALGVVATAAAISVGPLAAALLEAGHLPTLSYATVIPFVTLGPLAVTVVVLLGAAREGILHPVLPLGVALLLVLLMESLLRWTAALTPFLGGSELDGGRFYGLPNVFIGLLLGSSMYAASRLPALGGFAILLGAGLFAGFPWTGANLGGAVTLFAAAGLWLPLRARGQLGWRELLFAAIVVVAGTAIVLVANRLSSLPTHITTFERTTGAAGAWSTFVHRLGVGVRLIERNPFALAPVLGMLVTLAVVLRAPRLVAPSLERHPAWRDSLLVLLLASVVAYVANDSGAAACGVGFGMALGGLLYVSVAERTWKMVPA